MDKIPSKALQVNLEEFRVSVTVDPRYNVIKDVMSRYDGLQKVLDTFLEELCHPRRNWQFIVNEARTFSLGYFYDLKSHPLGDKAIRLYIDIAIETIKEAKEQNVKTDAFHNLFLLIQKTIRESGSDLSRMIPIILYGFEAMASLPDQMMKVIAQSYYQIKKLVREFLDILPEGSDAGPAANLLKAYYEYTFSYWLSERDPGKWFAEEISTDLSDEIIELFDPVSHENINRCMSRLREIFGKNDRYLPELLEEALDLPGYGEIVITYKNLPDAIFSIFEDEEMRHKCKLILLFHIMNIPGLANIHEETMREINRISNWLINHEDRNYVQQLIDKTFSILEKSFSTYPDAVLKSILNMGSGIYRTDDSDLVNYFNNHVVTLGFQTPDFRGITDDWQIISNKSHIQNIRTWMTLVSLKPKWSKKLLSSLIIHLSLCGVLIKDTDLFPRDITSFLKGDIQPVYNLVKQLMRLFPAYFNEIGAEGRLRDISTRIDEIFGRKDRLIHFLRKQSHVESSNKITSLMEATLEFWKTKSKLPLKPFLPPMIYEEITNDGKYVDNAHRILNKVMDTAGVKRISDLNLLEEDFINRIPAMFRADEQPDAERVSLAISFYKLLNQKYCVTACEVADYITQVQSSIPLNLRGLQETFTVKDTYKKIEGLLDYLEKLKAIILSPDEFKAREDIYRKRHIAADIPSMYGSYREAKFDALGLTFRIESHINRLFEDLIDELDLSFITHETFSKTYKYLKLFHRALTVDGIPAREFEEQLDLLRRSLKIKLFTFTQYVDIFRNLMQVVRNIVIDYFDNIHHQNLKEIASHLQPEKLQSKYSLDSDNREELLHKLAEVFLRDTIASSLGIQKLDLFLTRITNVLHEQAKELPHDRHYLLLTYNPRNTITSISRPRSHLLDIVHLGNKALNIIKMNEMGLPVPPGFIITTEVFRCRALIDSYTPATEHFRKQIRREMEALEEQTRRKFGSPENTLLVSVRSGSAVSQPGMMDSYLNVGINEDIVSGIIRQTGKEWFAWDSYRRFLQSYGMSFGLNRDEFDSIIRNYKKKYGIPLKKQFSPEQMKEVALAYKKHIQSRGITVEESPWEQLYISIERVLNSWNSKKAHTYRKIMGISDDWGTAVTVQEMVFGNISENSGSGVLFTHSPRFSTDILRPWGDYTIGNQGEDVVSGLVTTYPVSVYQAKMEGRPVEFALEKRFPAIYRALREYAKHLIYENQWAPQDIEFTFEGPEEKDLYILQTRNMEMRGRETYPAFESTKELSESILGHGIGVSGGAMTGRAVFSLEEISKYRSEEPHTHLILVRGDTVPDDIREISAADGLLTARGGATSHAAIVANRLGKTCVVGCKDLICMEHEKKFVLHDRTVNSGEFIAIDGYEGSIHYGKIKIAERGSD